MHLDLEALEDKSYLVLDPGAQKVHLTWQGRNVSCSWHVDKHLEPIFRACKFSIQSVDEFILVKKELDNYQKVLEDDLLYKSKVSSGS